MDIPDRHLCMAISNTTYYESLVTSLPVRRDPAVGPDGMLRAPTGAGAGLPPGLDYPAELADYVAETLPSQKNPVWVSGGN
ncbi:MAG: hypothetical protein WDM88_04990 [Galbitalea sp.]